jgi:hypothetical protein
MKKAFNILLLTPLLILSACSKDDTASAKKDLEPVVNKIEEKVEDKLTPKTISLKEVSRIALVEAKQFITLVAEQSPDSDISNINELYSQAEAFFDKGEFKDAQIKAVEVRHAVEEILIEAKK